MADDASLVQFEENLKARGWSYSKQNLPDGKPVFIISEYEVPNGRNAGKVVSIAFPIPADYPTTAPYGMHVKKGHGLAGGFSNIAGSPLGGDWEFWSRTVNNWVPGRRTASYYIDHVNLWLGGA